MSDEFKKLIEQDMTEEAAHIMEEVNASEELKDVKAPEEIHDKLFEQIRAYEESKLVEQLSDENKELLRLGKLYKKRRRKNVYFALAAVFILVLALGTVSLGEGGMVFEFLSWVLDGGEHTVVDSEETETIRYVEEDEVYAEIEKDFDFIPVKLEYLPENTKFCEATYGAEIQTMNMLFTIQDETTFIYMIRPNFRESSFGTNIEDPKVQEYQMHVNNVPIDIVEYLIEESGENRWSVCFEYQDVQYWLRITNLEQKEVEKIINGLCFFIDYK